MTEQELMMKRMQEIKEENQNKFIDKLLDQVEYLCEKANAKDYEPTEHEKNAFNKISTIINNMQNWF